MGVERRTMGRVAIMALMVLSLASCVRHGPMQPVNQSSVLRLNASPHFEDESLVVLGVKFIDAGSGDYGIMREVDGALQGEGKQTWGAMALCGAKNYPRCMDDKVIYHYYRMPPGTFAFAWASIPTGTYLWIDANNVKEVIVSNSQVYYHWHEKYDMSGARMMPVTPRFTVGKNEVLYVGNIVVTSKMPRSATIHYEENRQAAQTLLAEAGETRPMTVRPWTRPTGSKAQPYVREIAPKNTGGRGLYTGR